MNSSAPENNTVQSHSGGLPGSPAPAPAAGAAAPTQPQPRAKGGLLGIWANPKKYDTSAWNIYYYYYRQVASQHMSSCKIKFLKWVGLAANILFFGVPLWDSVGSKRPFIQSFLYINTFFFYLLVALLTLVPVVMIGNAFKLKARNIGFMTSRAKDPPLLMHLAEYTTCDRLISGAVQSLIYTYGLMLLYLLPSLVTYYVLESIYAKLSVYEIVAIPFSMMITSFLIMQRFCFRLDTLLFAFMLIVELGSNFRLFFLLAFLFDNGNLIIFGRSPWFLLFASVAGMLYFPLAAADTLEYGVGRNAARIRFLQLVIILFNLWALVYRASAITLESEWRSFSVFMSLPSLWVMLGLIGMLCSSLSAASFRAKACFISRTVMERKYNLFDRFINPASPCSAVSVCILEIAVALLFIVVAGSRSSRSFWDNSLGLGKDAVSDAKYMLLFAMMVFSAYHFSLALMYHFRRKSHTDKKPWQAHARFNGLVILFLIAFLLLFVFFGALTISVSRRVSDSTLFLPAVCYPLSILCLIASAFRESAEIRAARRQAENQYGLRQEELEIIR